MGRDVYITYIVKKDQINIQGLADLIAKKGGAKEMFLMTSDHPKDGWPVSIDKAVLPKDVPMFAIPGHMKLGEFHFDVHTGGTIEEEYYVFYQSIQWPYVRDDFSKKEFLMLLTFFMEVIHASNAFFAYIDIEELEGLNSTYAIEDKKDPPVNEGQLFKNPWDKELILNQLNYISKKVWEDNKEFIDSHEFKLKLPLKNGALLTVDKNGLFANIDNKDIKKAVRRWL